MIAPFLTLIIKYFDLPYKDFAAQQHKHVGRYLCA